MTSSGTMCPPSARVSCLTPWSSGQHTSCCHQEYLPQRWSLYSFDFISRFASRRSITVINSRTAMFFRRQGLRLVLRGFTSKDLAAAALDQSLHLVEYAHCCFPNPSRRTRFGSTWGCPAGVLWPLINLCIHFHLKIKVLYKFVTNRNTIYILKNLFNLKFFIIMQAFRKSWNNRPNTPLVFTNVFFRPEVFNASLHAVLCNVRDWMHVYGSSFLCKIIWACLDVKIHTLLASFKYFLAKGISFSRLVYFLCTLVYQVPAPKRQWRSFRPY